MPKMTDLDPPKPPKMTCFVAHSHTHAGEPILAAQERKEKQKARKITKNLLGAQPQGASRASPDRVLPPAPDLAVNGKRRIQNTVR